MHGAQTGDGEEERMGGGGSWRREDEEEEGLAVECRGTLWPRFRCDGKWIAGASQG